MNLKNAIFFGLFLLQFDNLFSQNLIKATRYVGGVSIPVDISHANDDRLFIIEKAGTISIIQNDVLLDTPFLDIVWKVNSRGNEQGLLGITFHPNYETTGTFYINYINKNTPNQTVIAKYTVDPKNPNHADTNSAEILLTIVQPYSNHNGGCLKFGKDGYLYIGMGDGGNGGDPQNYAQNKKSMLGKMLRIDVNQSSSYKIPADNPFVNNINYLDEIWALGLRNPWRFSFDRLNGDLWIGDVGQGEWEEVDFSAFGSQSGLNYGWRCYEGNHDFNTTGCGAKNTFTFPIHEYVSNENEDGCSITGGFVYRGTKYPSLYGKYIYADYCSGRIWALQRMPNGQINNVLALTFKRNTITTFGEDAQGELYFAAAAESAIYKIEDVCSLRIQSTIQSPHCFDSATGQITITNTMPNLTFKWSTGDTTNRLSKIKAGIYSVTVTQGLCQAIQNFELKNPEKISSCITNPFVTTICASDSALLVACDVDSSHQYQWYKDSSKLEGVTANRIFLRESGLYQVQVFDTAGCSSDLSTGVRITVNPLPAQPLISRNLDTLFATNGYPSYRWFKDGVLFSGTTKNSLIVLQKGSYRVSVIDSNLCESTRSDSIFVIPTSVENQLEVPYFSVYPNPVKEILYIDAKESISFSSKFLFNIVDAEGKNVHSIQLIDTLTSIRVKNYKPGIYQFYIIKKDKLIQQGRFIVD
ncbi:MAG: PQQ-dependent sugar dehydrogenase [Bacteroidota bacterium]|nr:PQQ-dependent sugar dehydrogenase [Bacteroidota bacterium]